MTKALYVHVPFCDKICAYCDFMRVITHPKLIDDYLKALQHELSRFPFESYRTIYIGGGTPTALNDVQLEALLKLLKPFSSCVEEYTIEVNPESLTPSKAALMRAYGINRVSLGVQTFDEKELTLLHRGHRVEDIHRSLETLMVHGITNLSIDLIYGLPLQTITSFDASLRLAMTLPIQHLSLYSLTIEPHSEFGRLNVKKMDDELEEEFYFHAVNVLRQHGFNQYEISNFTRSHPSQHNLTYWHYEDYRGVGPGAVSLINGQRIENTKNLMDYFAGKVQALIEPLSDQDQRDEFILMGLRIREGIALSRYADRYQRDLLMDYPRTQFLIEQGLLELHNDHLRATDRGYPLLLTLLGELLEH
jgi:oxygen-independent coproporphyrinogen III oxidase